LQHSSSNNIINHNNNSNNRNMAINKEDRNQDAITETKDAVRHPENDLDHPKDAALDRQIDDVPMKTRSIATNIQVNLHLASIIEIDLVQRNAMTEIAENMNMMTTKVQSAINKHNTHTNLNLNLPSSRPTWIKNNRHNSGKNSS
jgi:hypothetical protein